MPFGVTLNFYADEVDVLIAARNMEEAELLLLVYNETGNGMIRIWSRLVLTRKEYKPLVSVTV